jgi:hypothetical protein
MRSPRLAFLLLAALVLAAQPAGAGLNAWTSHGPQGAQVNALAIDPATPTILYAGTNGGGVFKSIDGGETWSAATSGLTATGVRAVVIDPKTPTTLYAGTSEGGVFKSIDGGGSWSPANTGLIKPFFKTVRALAIDPATPTTLYAAMFALGVFKSVDGGGAGARPTPAWLSSPSRP